MLLMYHHVSQDSGFPETLPRYRITKENFIKHLESYFLREFPPRVTVDDGGSDGMWIADALERYGMKGHFFIPTAFIGQHGFMSAPQIRELRGRGHIIGSHSHTHKIDRIAEEWELSVSILSGIIGEPVIHASVPGGAYTLDVAKEAARAGIMVLYTSEPVTEFESVDGCLITGRYTVYSDTAARDVFRWTWRLGQYLKWNTRKTLRRISRRHYRALKVMVEGRV